MSVRGSLDPDAAAGAPGCGPTHLARRLHLQPQAVRLSSAHATATAEVVGLKEHFKGTAACLAFVLPPA